MKHKRGVVMTEIEITEIEMSWLEEEVEKLEIEVQRTKVLLLNKKLKLFLLNTYPTDEDLIEEFVGDLLRGLNEASTSHKISAIMANIRETFNKEIVKCKGV